MRPPRATFALTGWLRGGVALVKFRYHITFINVIFGALIFATKLDWVLAWRLFGLYLSFNVVLYSGLYTINDLADRKSDSEHPLKRQRPIPSGRVSISAALAWAVVFLATGLASGAYFFSAPVVACYFAVVVINLAYSWGGRDIVYLDVLLNSLPHVVRFLMGALFVARQPPITQLVAFLLLAVAFSCLRRRIEHDVEGWEARQSLRTWSISALNRVMIGSLVGVFFLAAWQGAAAPGFYAALVGTAVVLVGGAHTSRQIRRRLQRVWTH